MPGLTPHELEQWLDEVSLFTDWYCPALGWRSTRRPIWQAGRQAWAERADIGRATSGRSLVLRDYHAENIMLVAGRGRHRQLGLLDFQDALAGHPAYDLASVLEDARRDVTPLGRARDARSLL